ncbi:MAG: hypothetical protein ACM3TR_08785 [Caulobacteraceae bacterium]
MVQNENEVLGKSKKTTSTIVLYVFAVVVAVAAAAYFINNIILFNSVVNQYVAQGYPKADVIKQLVQSQLFPGIVEPIVVYGGIAALLFAAGAINQKVNNCLALLTKNEVSEDAEEGILENDAVESENTEMEAVETEAEEADDNKPAE